MPKEKMIFTNAQRADLEAVHSLGKRM